MKTDLMMLCRLGVAPVLAALVLAGCGSAKPAPAPPPPQVSVVTVHRGSVPITTELPGRTSAYLVAQVRARVDGIVLKREFKEGGEVKAGQRLYQIDPAPYIAALNSATASLQKAEANLASTTAQAERFKVLVAANAVSKQDYDNAVATQGQAAADVATGKAAVAMAQINLGYTNVMSPITGRSGLSLVTRGCVRASERSDAHDDRPADRSDLRGPHAVERRGLAIAARHCFRSVEAERSRSSEGHVDSWKTARNIR